MTDTISELERTAIKGRSLWQDAYGRFLRNRAAVGASIVLVLMIAFVLIGPQFALATGCRLLDEWHVARIAGRRVLLTHGDLLCTDDEPYMALRATVRDPVWQRDFLAKPLEERRAIADALRARSQTETASKPAEIMDVNAKAVIRAFGEHRVDALLHGHTHRPAVHELTVAGRPATRIVLGTWYETGSVVRWDERGFRLEELKGSE